MRTFPILVDLGFIVSAATALLLAGRALRLPQILSYMVAGLLLGPATGLIGTDGSVALIAEMGVALLLFLVGMELSLERVRDVGAAALTTGLLQVAITALLGTGLCLWMGLGPTDAAVLGFALAFSSTVVVIKLLERSGGVGTPAGRITVGILLVQDVVVAVALTAIGGLERGGSGFGALGADLGRALGGILALGLGAAAAVRWILPRLLRWIAASAETLLVVSLTWCFLFILAAEALGISIELGAFTAGLAIAQLPYADELVRRVHALADLFLAVFFVALGAGMDPAAALALWPQALALSAFVLLVKPALVMALLTRQRYDGRTSFLAGITLGQVSEFAFLLVAAALASGVSTSPDLTPLIGLVGLITIGLSAALVPHGPSLFRRLSRRLPEGGGEEAPPEPRLEGHVVVVGMNTLGRAVVRRLADRGTSVVAIDTDPAKLLDLPARAVYGNGSSTAVLREAQVEHALLVVAAPQIEDVTALLVYRCHRWGVPVSAHAFDPALMDELLDLGADHVMVPKLDGARLVERELIRLGVLG